MKPGPLAAQRDSLVVPEPGSCGDFARQQGGDGVEADVHGSHPAGAATAPGHDRVQNRRVTGHGGDPGGLILPLAGRGAWRGGLQRSKVTNDNDNDASYGSASRT